MLEATPEAVRDAGRQEQEAVRSGLDGEALRKALQELGAVRAAALKARAARKEADREGPLMKPLPVPVVEHVMRNYGPLADRVLREAKDPRFCNPLLMVDLKQGVVYDRLDNFWAYPWSVSEPERGSLTEFYLQAGLIGFGAGGEPFFRRHAAGLQQPALVRGTGKFPTGVDASAAE